MIETPTLQSFGHDSITQNGRSAIGNRPLVIILAEYNNLPPLANAHPIAYYWDLATGNPSPPFSTRGPINPASLHKYFLENSSGRFQLGPAILSNVQLGPYQPSSDHGPEERCANLLHRSFSEKANIPFGMDTSKDGWVGYDELCVLIVENIPGAWPANRPNKPVSFVWNARNVSIVTQCAGVGPTTRVQSIYTIRGFLVPTTCC